MTAATRTVCRFGTPSAGRRSTPAANLNRCPSPGRPHCCRSQAQSRVSPSRPPIRFGELILIAAIALLAVAAIDVAGLPITLWSFLLAGVAALGFGPLTSAYALGQLALPAYAFAALGTRRSWALLPAWLQPNIAPAAAGAPRFFAYSLLFAAICTAVYGRGILHYLSVLRAHGAAENLAVIQLTPASIAYGFGAAPAAAAIAGGIIAAGALAIWLTKVLPMPDPVLRFCATCALLPFVLPFFHEHDLIVEFVPAIVLARRMQGAACAWTLAAAMLCAIDWLGLAQRPEALPQALLLAAAFAGALIASRPQLTLKTLIVPAAMLLIVAAAGIVAAQHAAPVWPDAMAPLSPKVASGGISAAWHAELAATGLLARNAFWAGLRLGSLLGCAGLATAALRALDVDVHHVIELRDGVGVEVL